MNTKKDEKRRTSLDDDLDRIFKKGKDEKKSDTNVTSEETYTPYHYYVKQQQPSKTLEESKGKFDCCTIL